MNKPLDVWLVDDDASIRWVLEKALRQGGMQPRAFEQAESALAALGRAEPDVLITDVRMPGQSGLKLLETVRSEHPRLPVIVMTAHSDLDSAVAAYQGGAFEYLPKPFDIDQAVALVRRAAAQVGASASIEPATRGIPEILGQAPAMQEVFRAIGRLSRSSMTVLITGESGTGKELVARALHRHSPRAAKPFIALNTSAFTAELLESELFGHEKGAFTGAEALRRGRFEQPTRHAVPRRDRRHVHRAADPAAARARRGRVLPRGGQYAHPRGRARDRGHAPGPRGARRTGAVPRGLLHRLNVIRIAIPPLRARREDIPELLRHYLAAAAEELGVERKTLAPTAEATLAGFNWPGNVRQLVNAARRLTVTAPGREIRVEDVPPDLGGAGARPAARRSGAASWRPGRGGISRGPAQSRCSTSRCPSSSAR